MLVWEVMTKFTFPQSFGKSIVSRSLCDPFQRRCREWEDVMVPTNRTSLNSHQLTGEETLLSLLLLFASSGHIEFVSRAIGEAFGLTRVSTSVP